MFCEMPVVKALMALVVHQVPRPRDGSQWTDAPPNNGMQTDGAARRR